MDDTTVLVAVDSGQVLGVGDIDLRGAVPIIWKLYVRPQVAASRARYVRVLRIGYTETRWLLARM